MQKLVVVCWFLSAFLLSLPVGVSGDALFYESFDEHDPRPMGILPDGVERVRISGRLFGTEMEIEAPSGGGDTSSLAQFILDPTGLSMIALQLEDRGTEVGDGSLGADGGVSLFEPILLDQGDVAGKAAVSWMSIPRQNDEPGGAMFPETDSRLDSGPEGLNLIGFGGVSRDFDTGEPIPGQDFTGQLTFNREGSSQITSLGVNYDVNEPIFFMLLFDLENSMYDIFINGVKVRSDVPFFDVNGETGKTLRELELISSARGVGTFVYDNVFQLDPDKPHRPIPYRTPIIADDLNHRVLFDETFDDDPLQVLPADAKGNVVGSRIRAMGNVEVVSDSSYQSPARGLLPADSSLECAFSANDSADPLRFATCVTPGEGSGLLFLGGDSAFMNLSAGGFLSIDQDGDGTLDQTDIEIIEAMPHWIVVRFDPDQSDYNVTVYRATSKTQADTVTLQAQGTWNGNIKAIRIENSGASSYIDNLLVVREKTATDGGDENRYHAVVSETFDTAQTGDFPGQVENDPTGWSLSALNTDTGQETIIGSGLNIQRSARISWTAVPTTDQVISNVLSITVKNDDESLTQALAGFLPDGSIGVEMDGDGELESTSIPYRLHQRNQISVILDLETGSGEVVLDNNQRYPLSGLYSGDGFVQLQDVRLSGNTGHPIYYDDLLIVADHFGVLYDEAPYEAPALTGDMQLLFEEDFENNPARSEQKIDEFDPRRSGLPIETRSSGFSNRALTDVEGTILTVGAPSADAAYVTDPDGGSLYGLMINDQYGPQDFSGFQRAVPINPISTLRTTPYAFVLPELSSAPASRYVQLRWSASALQDDKAGLALFLSVEDVEVPLPGSPLTVPAPSAGMIVGFGEQGRFVIDQNGDGQPEESNIAYQKGQTYRFMLIVDQQTNTFNLEINNQPVAENVELNPAIVTDDFMNRLGWFTTLVTSGDGNELQQSPRGGGSYIIDDIRIIEMNELTSVGDYPLY